MQIAVDAVGAASRPHSFLSVTKAGQSAIFRTSGNEDCHLILRGGTTPNYDAAGVEDAVALMEKSGLSPRILIDTSHANSRKKPARQVDVGLNIAHQIQKGDTRIMGVMIESNLVEGAQKVVAGEELVRGQSITDPCLSWAHTIPLLKELAAASRVRRNMA